MQTNSVLLASVRRRHLEHLPVDFITLKQIMHDIVKHPIRNTTLESLQKLGKIMFTKPRHQLTCYVRGRLQCTQLFSTSQLCDLGCGIAHVQMYTLDQLHAAKSNSTQGGKAKCYVKVISSAGLNRTKSRIKMWCR